jgi:predicted HicB family RNase H-like nuclease
MRLRDEGGRMPIDGEVWVQLATRIPKQLHRELKLHCVKSDVSVMDFVVKALGEKLQREAGGKSERRRRSA